MRALKVLAVLPPIAAMVAAAAAFACTPQAYMTLDKEAYSPGDRVTIRGHLFDAKSDRPVTVRAGADRLVLGQRQIAEDGSWDLSFDLPSDTPKGTYNVTADAPGSYKKILGLTTEQASKGSWPAVRLALRVGRPPAPPGKETQPATDPLPPAGQTPQPPRSRNDARRGEHAGSQGDARVRETDAGGSAGSATPAGPGRPVTEGAPASTAAPRPAADLRRSEAAGRTRPGSPAPGPRLRPSEPPNSWPAPGTSEKLAPLQASPEGPMVPWYVVAIGAATLLLVGGAAAGLLIARRRRLPPPDAVESTREPLAPEPGAGKPEPDAPVAPPPDAVEAALQELIAEHRARQGDLAERT